MDALAHQKLALGQKAVSLDLGWMKSESVVAEKEYLGKGFAAAGFLMPVWQKWFPSAVGAVLRILSLHCANARDASGSSWARNPRSSACEGHRPSLLLPPPYLPSSLSNRSSKKLLPVEFLSWKRNRLRHLLYGCRFPTEASSVVSDALVKKIAKALSIPGEDIDTSKPLHAYAVDSLLAIELRNWFAKEFTADVAIFDIMGASSFGTVERTVAGISKSNRQWEQ